MEIQKIFKNFVKSFYYFFKIQEKTNIVNNHQLISQNKASFVDTSPIFEDLNASFKRLYKSILNNRELFESGFNSNLGSSIKIEPQASLPINIETAPLPVKQSDNNTHSLSTFQVKNHGFSEATNNQQQTTVAGMNHTFTEPTLNTLNSMDFNTSFDTFMQSIRIASNGEINWNLNDIDPSEFKCKK